MIQLGDCGVGSAINSRALTYRFGRQLAVDGLDLEVQAGTITGFLGPNGAGKTTTIRLLLGLIKPQAGTCKVLGLPPGHPQGLAKIGALVEYPSLYDHLTGWENVEITRLMKDAPPSDTSRVLSIVGLTGDARRAVRTYSLGMRQRLGIGLALIGEPRLLILDEPNNGLDPLGILEMRELIGRLAKDLGVTIFLSSHVLSEVEQIVSHVVVIHKGKLRFQGSIQDLDASSETPLCIHVDRPSEAVHFLQNEGVVVDTKGERLVVSAQLPDAPRIAALLVKGGFLLYEMVRVHESLEAKFLSLLSLNDENP